MTHILAVGLAIGLATAVPAASTSHSVDIDHHSGPVKASYHGALMVKQEQVGTVAPGGRVSSLRCAWSASLKVNRQARAATGTVMTREFVRDDVASGHRTGWCDTNRTAIAQEVASLKPAIDGHLQIVAQEDHDQLRAELDRLHGTMQTE